MIIDILRGISTVTASFKVSEDVKFVSQLMGERKVVARFQSSVVLDIRIGDYIVHRSEVYTVNNQPEVTKLAERIYEYNIEFEAEIYSLYNKIIMDEGSADFSYFGTPQEYIDLLLLNINSIDAGWTAGTVEVSDPKPLTFVNETCRQALTRIAEVFELEFNVVNKRIDLVGNVGNDISLLLQYGKGNGLYSLTRKRLNDQSVITRLYAFGGQKNIDFDYRNGATRLIFEGGKLESNIALYGVREGSVTFDNIFPQRTSTVSDLPASGDIFSIFDSTIDFDINEYLLEGVTAKIVFKSGDLAGYQFEITAYDHTTKKITFAEFTEENDYKLPNAVVKAALGDQYTLVDIKMPASYITAAETQLQTKAQEYLNNNDHPTVTYAFECDEKFLIDGSINFRVGDEVRIIDAPLSIDSTLRISEITYPLLYPKRISAAISEGVEYTTTERIIKVTTQQVKELRTVDRTSQEQARLNALRMRELQGAIFDPDGYFDTTNIKPNSIETIYLAVGVKSQSFALSGMVFTPNESGLPANFYWTGGELVHYEIAENIRTWQLAAGGRADLLDADVYYVYARCPIVGAQGTIIVTTAQIRVEQEAGFYNFLIGVLHSAIDGVRGISLTYGQTNINGKFIRTGTIFSQDGLTYFDLDAGVIGGKIEFAAGSSGYNNLQDLPGANPYFEQGTRLWSRANDLLDTEGESIPENITDAILNQGNWGGKVLRIEDQGPYYYCWKNPVPVITDQTYKGRVRLRIADYGLSQEIYFSCGVLTYDENFNLISEEPFINDLQSSFNQFDWFTFEATINSGTGTYSLSGVSYVRPYFRANMNGDQAITDIDGLEFKEFNEVGDLGLGNLAYEDLVSAAQLDTTIIEGGFIKTSLIDTEALIVSGSLATQQFAQDAVENLEFSLGGMAYKDLVSLATLDNTIILGGFIKTTLIDVQTLIVSGDLETTAGAASKVSALQKQLGDIAYDDLISIAKLDTTIIQGGYIKTSLIDVDVLVARNVLTSVSGKRIQISGSLNKISFYNASGNEVVTIDEITQSGGNDYSGVFIKDNTGNSKTRLLGDGLFSNGSRTRLGSGGLDFFSEGSIVGVLTRDNDNASVVNAAVIGFDESSGNTNPVFGGYFNTLLAGGLHFQTVERTSSTNYTVAKSIVSVLMSNTSGKPTISLPSNPQLGRFVLIRTGVTAIFVSGNGNNIRNIGGAVQATNDIAAQRCIAYIYMNGWQMMFYS